MELKKIKQVVKELGLTFDENLTLYKGDGEVGRIYQVRGTNQYGLDVNFTEQNSSKNGLRIEDILHS